MELLFQLVEGYQAGRIAHQIECQFLERSDRLQVIAGGDIPVEHIIVQAPQQGHFRIFERLRDPAHLQVRAQSRLQPSLISRGHPL